MTEDGWLGHSAELRDCTVHNYYSSDQIENKEMGWACSPYEEIEELHTRFWWEDVGEKDHLEDLGAEGS